MLSDTLRRRFHVPTADLLARSTPLMIGPVEVRTFDATDTLVHLCHHAAFSDYHQATREREGFLQWLAQLNESDQAGALVHQLRPERPRLAAPVDYA